MEANEVSNLDKNELIATKIETSRTHQSSETIPLPLLVFNSTFILGSLVTKKMLSYGNSIPLGSLEKSITLSPTMVLQNLFGASKYCNSVYF